MIISAPDNSDCFGTLFEFSADMKDDISKPSMTTRFSSSDFDDDECSLSDDALFSDESERNNQSASASERDFQESASSLPSWAEFGGAAPPPPPAASSRSVSVGGAIPFTLSALQKASRPVLSRSASSGATSNGTFFESIPTRLFKLKTAVEPSQEKEVMLDHDYQLSPNDVLCGGNKKGSSSKESARHPGNERFRVLIQSHVERYRNAATRNDKTQLVRQVVQLVRQSGGRFVHKKAGYYHDIGDKKARDKVGHALRSATNKLQPASSGALNSSFSSGLTSSFSSVSSSNAVNDNEQTIVAAAATTTSTATGMTSVSVEETTSPMAAPALVTISQEKPPPVASNPSLATTAASNVDALDGISVDETNTSSTTDTSTTTEESSTISSLGLSSRGSILMLPPKRLSQAEMQQRRKSSLRNSNSSMSGVRNSLRHSLIPDWTGLSTLAMEWSDHLTINEEPSAPFQPNNDNEQQHEGGPRSDK